MVSKKIDTSRRNIICVGGTRRGHNDDDNNDNDPVLVVSAARSNPVNIAAIVGWACDEEFADERFTDPSTFLDLQSKNLGPRSLG